MTLFTGTIKLNAKGFGFIESEDGTSVFVAPKLLKTVFYFDTVQVQAEQAEDGRWAASSLAILEKPRRRLAGTILKENDGYLFVPEIGVLPPFYVYANGKIPVADGDRVVSTAFLTPNGWTMETQWNGGQLTNPNCESHISLALYEIPTKDSVWAPELNSNSKARTDLTSLNFVTIDSESTTDIDDAVYVERTSSGFTLYVAIADASEYVPLDSELDKTAFTKGTTVYFAQKVYPMLPRQISSGEASLLPMATRMALVAKMDIDTNGVTSHVELVEALIQSKAKLSYNEVRAMVEDGLVHSQSEHMTALFDFYNVMLNARISRGATPIRTGDYAFELNADGKVQTVVHKPWQVAYGMVEECMLAANTHVAEWMVEHDLLGLYRHHKGPDSEAWLNQVQYLEAIGLGDISRTPTPVELAELTVVAETLGEGFGVENAIRSTMRPATYQVHAPSHFSLAYEHYTHFTSPIRRYADLTVHRIIKKALRHEPMFEASYLEKVATQCSLADQRAKKATREEAKRLKVQYAQKWVNTVQELTLSGGNNSGWFLKNAVLPLDTFAALGPLKSQWQWNPLLQRATHSDGTTFKLGDSMKVQIQEVNTLQWRIEAKPEVWKPLALVSPGPTI